MNVNKAAPAVKRENFVKRGFKKACSFVSNGVSSILDEFVPRRKFTSVEIEIDSPEYKNVTVEDAAKMMGYFVQKMEKQGFPWAVYKPKTGLVKMTPVGEYQALKRLENNESVIFQPRRVIGLGFNPPQLKGKDITGAEAKGKMDIKTGGMEVNHGKPVEIKDFKDLKFLYELYNPDIDIDQTKSRMNSAARELAFFTKGTMQTEYPWKMYKPMSRGKRFIAGVKQAVKSGARWAGIGATAAYIAKLSSLAIGMGAAGPAVLLLGAGIGAGYGIIKGMLSKRHGEEISPFEALDRLSEKKPVYMQEQKKKEIGISVPFPVMIQLGSLSYFTEHGEGSTIKNLDELKLFHKIQEEEKPKPKQ